MADTIDTIAAALELAARGIPLFPVRSTTDNKKIPLVEWRDEATTNPERIESWWRVFPRAMIGVPGGAASGFFAIDVDARDGGREAWGKLVAENGLPETRRHSTPRDGEHIILRWRPGITNSTGRLPKGIDVRGEGGFMVWAGSRNWEGKRYKIVADAEIADAPPWLVEMIARAPDWRTVLPEWLAAKIAPDAGKGVSTNAYDLPQRTDSDPERLRAALAVVPSDDEQVWYKVACALRNELGEAGWPLFHEWSAKSHKYKDTREPGCRRKWEGCDGYTDITAGTIFHYADEADPGWRRGAPSQGRIEPTKAGRPQVEEPAAAHQPVGLGEWDVGDDDEPIPPRQWLLGNVFCRTFLSSIVGEGGTGKTALRVAQALAMATGRPLTGEHVFQRSRVLLVCLEDDRDELRRRCRAAMQHHGIAQADVRGWLFTAAPGRDVGKVVVADDRGRTTEGPLLETLRQAIAARRIDALILDPFVKVHGVEENSNPQMDAVVQVLVQLASETGIALDVPHHVSKGAGDPGNANRGRGASAAKDGARLVYTLTTMSKDEAEQFGIHEGERRFYFRVDAGKVNIAPPARVAKWFRLVSVDLGNGSELYPSGDHVQTVEPWAVPDTWEGIGEDVLARIVASIDAGMEDGRRYTDAPAGGDRHAWHVVAHHTGKTDKQSRAIVRELVEKLKMLERRDYRDPVDRRDRKGLFAKPEVM